MSLEVFKMNKKEGMGLCSESLFIVCPFVTNLNNYTKH